MTRLFFALLTLFFLSGPAMGENSDFRRCLLAAKGLDQTYSLGLQSSRSTVLQANRGLYDDFIASGGKLIRQRDVAQFASDGVTPVLGRYNTVENSISLFKGSNLSTVSEELIHFRQIQNGGYLYKPFPKSMVPGLESDASTVLQQWASNHNELCRSKV